jgi:hypothetical protein
VTQAARGILEILNPEGPDRLHDVASNTAQWHLGFLTRWWHIHSRFIL